MSENTIKKTSKVLVDFEYQYITCKNPSGTHQMSYIEWGSDDADIILFAVHALTGDATNYDFLANYLLKYNIKTVSVDVLGRGNSDKIDSHLYTLHQYAQDVDTLYHHIRNKSNVNAVFHYIGTSLGGLIALTMAKNDIFPFSSLILNDIGPIVPSPIISHIHKYVSDSDLVFPTLKEAAEFSANLYKDAFGPFADFEYFYHRSKYAFNFCEKKGGYVYHYDREGTLHGLIDTNSCDKPVSQELLTTSNLSGEKRDIENMTYWEGWNKVNCPILVYQGVNSVLCTQDLVNQMIATKPDTKVITWEATGHIPPLYVEKEFVPIYEFITQLKQQ